MTITPGTPYTDPTTGQQFMADAAGQWQPVAPAAPPVTPQPAAMPAPQMPGAPAPGFNMPPQMAPAPAAAPAPAMPAPQMPQGPQMFPSGIPVPGVPGPAAPAGVTTINWAELQQEAATGVASPVPPGTYDVQIVEAKYVTTGNGKHMWKTKGKVMGGPQDGRVIWNNFVLSPESPNALSFFFQHMGVFGMDQAYFAQSPSPEVVAANFVGKFARYETELVQSGQYKGNCDVKKIAPMPPGGGQAGPGPQMPQPGAPAPGFPPAVPQAPAFPQPGVAPALPPQMPGAPYGQQ